MPISIEKAREIISDLNCQSFPKDSQASWIFVLCGDESESADNTTFLLATCLINQGNSCGFAKYNGIVKEENKSMEMLLKRHFSLIPFKTKLNTRIESTFEITPDISLKFVNNTSAPRPSLDHIDESSEVVLSQQVQLGKSHILCEDFWSEIQLLNSIKSDIINFKNNSIDGTFNDPSYNYGGDLTFEMLQEKVNLILSEMNTIKEESDAIVDTGLEAVIKRARHRPLAEITDQLWHLLKFTSTYGDLKKVITFIFQISSRSNIVNIPTNNNRLGELIRELCLQRLAIPHLVGTEPLELLLEIGIEKIMKDFEFIFSESKICKVSDMIGGEKANQPKGDKQLNVRKSLAAAAVDLNQSDKARKTLLKGGSSLDSNDDDDGIKNSRFVEREVETKISQLAQVHLIVEHLLLIQNNLSMDNDYNAITKKLFEKPLLSFDDLQGQKFDHFQFAINDKKASF